MTEKGETFQSAQVVKTAEGRQYHIGVAPGEVAPSILLCGDPARAERVSQNFFTDVTVERRNREYVTFTGKTKGAGVPISVMATGIGTDNTEIAVIELCQCVERPTLLRIGSSGGLQPGMQLGDLVISTGGVKLESTSDYFVPPGYPSVADHEVVLALMEAAESLGDVRWHTGLTATACGFYGAQGRVVPGFPPRRPEIPAELEAIGVKNLEMETSLLLTLAGLRGVRAGAVCALYALRHEDVFIDTATKDRAELDCIRTGVAAIEVLARMDAKRGDAARWLPSHGF